MKLLFELHILAILFTCLAMAPNMAQAAPAKERAIVALKTQVVFIGTFKSGPTDKPVRVANIKEFLTTFGPLENEFETAMQVRQFFTNGGGPLTIVRVAGAAILEQPTNLLTALHTLDSAGGMFLLVIPQITSIILPSVRDSMYAAVLEFASNTQSFFIMDAPAEIKTPEAMAAWRDQFPKNNLSQGAIFYPAVKVAGVPAGKPPLFIGASGSIAGIIANTEKERGISKEPKNVELEGTYQLEVKLTDAQSLALMTDPATGMSVNALRFNPDRGVFLVSARTMDGNGVDWRNLNVRRNVSYIEGSLRNSMGWVANEPFTCAVCNEIKREISVFLTDHFKKGGLVGAKADETFSVLCGLGATMTATDILNGNVRVTVLIAPERPAEFIEITLKLKSKTAQ